jgi:hypothetical protein
MLNDIVLVRKEHIDPGIKKYQGVIDPYLQKLLEDAGHEYTPYRFKDNRILVVFPNSSHALLYPNEQEVARKLDLSNM